MTLAELKARALALGLTHDEVRQHGNLSYKATWEKAITEFEQWKESVNTHSLTCSEQMDIPQWSYPEDENKGVVEEEPIAVTVNQGKTEEPVTEEETVTEMFQCPDCGGKGGHTTEIDGTGWEVCPWCNGKETVTSEVLEQWEDLIGQLNADVFNDELPFEPTHTLIDGEWVKIEDIPVSNSVTLIHSSPILPFTFNPTKPCKPDNSGYLVWNDKLRNWVKEKPSESSTPYLDKLLAKMMGYVDKGVTLDALADMQKNPPDECTAAIYLGLLEESERMLREALVA